VVLGQLDSTSANQLRDNVVEGTKQVVYDVADGDAEVKLQEWLDLNEYRKPAVFVRILASKVVC
jgi:hypothetical protein